MARLFNTTYCQWRQWRRLTTAPRMALARDNHGVRGLSTHCQSDIDQQYEETVQTLNSLQSNAAVLQRIRQERGSRGSANIPAVERYLDRVGVTLQDIDSLSVIHIAGTKGKGSTCSFIESILREHGFRTGFYSSPHLVAVRERIRINGQPISKEDFTSYFWDVYSQLMAKKTSEGDMPAYFKFLTVLALKIFLREEVDVAVLEVGIGGEYDCTNVVRRPVACGITTLDYDHTSILGNTIESIAWHKAGIMKPGIPTFTVEQPLQPALNVLLERAKEKENPLYLVPPLENYGWGAQPLQLGLAGNVQYCNASLALQLSQYWINSQTGGKSDVHTTAPASDHLNLPVAAPFTLSDEEVQGLKSAVWPGRSQVMVSGPLTFFLDGAHTPVSMQACVDWFLKTAPMHAPQNGNKTFRLLFFNSTGDRDPETLLQILAPCNFDLAIFTTNLVTTSMSASSDQTNYTISQDQMHLRCERQRSSWIRLIRNQSKQKSESKNQEDTEMASTAQAEVLENNTNLTSSLPASDVPSIIFPCIQDALVWLSCGRDPSLTGELLTPPAFPPPALLQKATQVQILVTGSLHLVGGVLGVIDPELRCATHVRSVRSQPPSLTDLVLNNYNKFSSPGTP